MKQIVNNKVKKVILENLYYCNFNLVKINNLCNNKVVKNFQNNYQALAKICKILTIIIIANKILKKQVTKVKSK